MSEGPYEVGTTVPFERALRRFFRRRRDLAPRFLQLVQDLEENLYQPKLRLHALSGGLDGFHAVSLTYSHRVVLILQVEERRIRLVDIGDLDEVYR